MEKYSKEKILNEFNYLKQNIDYNQEYEAKKIPNNKLNRYANIRPYLNTLVHIYSENNYINASWIHIPEKYEFIATQGPLDTTIDDFWEMCYQYNTNIVIMLCQLKENDKIKCVNYWDKNNIKKFIFNQINEEIEINGIIIRNFELKKSINQNFPKNIIQLHYTCWKDHMAPEENSYRRLIELIEFIDMYKGNSPVVTHCSAGVGRTGTFIALYNLYHDIIKQINDDGVTEIKFSIMNVVRKLKEMRSHLVENEDQYLFLYQFVYLLLKDKNLV